LRIAQVKYITWNASGSQTTKHNSKIWTKKVKYRQSGKKELITVIGCGNAIGHSIPLMVIFEGKYLNYEW